MKTVAINNGYYQCKSMDRYIFKSKIKKCLYEDTQSNCDILTTNGETYIIGEGDFCIDDDKTQNETNKLLILNMLAKFMDTDKSNKEAFNIVLSTPPSMYKHQSVALPSYLEGYYNIKVNGKELDININKVKIYPETFIVYLNYQEEYKNKNLLIFDIGGNTTNICLVKRGSFTNSDYITINNAMYHVDSNISQYLNSKYPEYHFSIDDIQYLRDTENELLIAEQPALDIIYNEYVQELLNALKLKQWNYKIYSILCIGGGSKILFDNISMEFPQAKLSVDPIFENEKALEKLAVKGLSKK